MFGRMHSGEKKKEKVERESRPAAEALFTLPEEIQKWDFYSENTSNIFRPHYT